MRCKQLDILFFLFALLYSTSLLAQETGSPFSRNYHATEFKAHTQNWAVVQDHRGVLYFANKEGVLEYDGAHWNLIKVSRDVRSLDVDANGTVFVGAIGDFGYLEPDLTGKLQFMSLTDKLDTAAKNFEDIWKVYATTEGVYYQSSKWLLRYDKGKVKVWYPQKINGFHFCYWVKGKLYIREAGRGLLEMKEDKLVPAQGGDVFADERIYTMLPYDTQRILIGTRNLGLFIWNPENGELQKFATPAYQFLIDNQLYHGIKLRNGNFVFATITGGAVVLNAAGQVEQTINKQAFLQNESVYYLYNDRQNNLWMALDNGISNIEIESPWLQWNESHGLKGIVYSVMRHNGVLYAGTSQGAFYLENNNFIQIEGIKGQTWDLLSIPENKEKKYAAKLLIGNATGIYDVEKGKAKQLFAGSHCLKLYHSKHDAAKVYTGFDNSLALLELQGNATIFRGKIRDIEGEIRNISEDDEGNIIINIPFRGLCVVSPETKMEKFTASEIVYIGEDKGFNTVESEVFTLHGKLYFTKNKKLYHFNETDGKFEENPLLDKYLNIGNITHLANDSMGDIWMGLILNSSKKEAIGVLRKQKDGNYSDDLESFKRLPQMSIQEVYPEDNGVVWIGGSGGLFRYNTEITGYYNTAYNTLIRRVYLNEDSLIFNGSYFKQEENSFLKVASLEQPKEMQFDLGYDFNEITFHFSAPYFTDENQTLYSYYLENFDRTWSGWHTHTSREYTNLPEGNYTFHVKAKNIYGLESKEAMYKFRIHPPWYRTRWAYICYVVVSLLTFWGVLRTYTQKLQRDKVRLEQLVTERTVELEHQKEEVLSQSADLKVLNEGMAVKTAELEIQKAEIEKKNDDIKASLNYAQRIQTALLPSTGKMREAFDDFFVLIMPRDIVSGDYYWFTEIRKNRPEKKIGVQEPETDVRNMRFSPDAREFVAFNGDDYTVPIGFQVLTKYTVITAADCTGHGVPGALMSMIGNNLLNEIVLMRSIIEPNEILSAMNTGIRTLLKQDESKNKDGMDMALCVIDWHDKMLHFSGAKNPLMYVRNGEIIEVKADKKSIGGASGLAKSDTTNIFATSSIPLDETIEFYMMSDGYEDQFGGEENRKFMKKNLRELLFKIHKLPMVEQEKILRKTIVDWMGTNHHQLDDILVTGFRIEKKEE
jgi:serine phosphatase RsbU (regulator of sigma subunit)/ligand-binding sensor domain-containing protein